MDEKQFEEHKKNCEMCKHTGMLVLPTRYAIAQKGSNAPKVSAPFQLEQSIALDTDTYYTQRLLRKGYLYVYDPNRKGLLEGEIVPNPWKSYVVNGNGYLMPYTGWRETHKKPVSEPCDPFNFGIAARCFSIAFPEEARTVWIAFSDTMWTKSVFDEHEKKANRDRNMRSFHVGQWFNGKDTTEPGTHPHACSINQYKPHIAEMCSAMLAQEAFEFSEASLNRPIGYANLQGMLDAINAERANRGEGPFQVKSYPLTLSGLVPEYSRLKMPVSYQTFGFRDSDEQFAVAAERIMGKAKNKAAVLALDDPAGILMDLAVYLDYKHAKFEQALLKDREHNLERKLPTISLIRGLELSVKNNIADALEKLARTKPVALMPITGGVTFGYGGQVHAAGVMSDPKRLEEIQTARWKPYIKKYNAAAVEETEKYYNGQLGTFDKEHIAPLANAWVAWFTSPRFIASMQCNHDPKDVKSGIGYAELVSHCVGACQNKLPIIQELLAQLRSDATDPEKVLTRAFILNQDRAAKIMQAALDKVNTDGDISAQLDSWAAVLKEADAFYDEAMNNTTLMTARNTVISTLTGQVIGAALSKMNSAIAKGPIPRWLVKFGLVSHMPIIKLEFSGTVSEIADCLADRYSGLVDGIDKKTARRAIEARLGETYYSKGVHSFSFFAAVDEEKMRKALAEAKTAAEKARAVTDNMRISSNNQHASLLYNRVDARNFHDADMIYRNKAPTSLDTFNRFKTVDLAYSRSKTAAAAQSVALPSAAAVVTSGLTIWMFLSAAEVLRDQMARGNATKVEINNAWLSFIGVSFVAIHGLAEAMEKMAQAAPRLAELVPSFFDKNKFFLKFATRGLGGVGGIILGVLDYGEFKKARDNEQHGLATVYLITAATSFIPGSLLLISVIAHAFGYAKLGAGAAALVSTYAWPILIIGVVAALGVLILTDDAMQSWLGECFFGTHKKRCYTVEEEIDGLKKRGFQIADNPLAAA